MGQPTTCTMAINCSSRWSGGEEGTLGKEGSEVVWMAYELATDAADWLVSGRKKGSFIATVRP